MANKTMKTLTIGGNKYEIVDETARANIEALKQGASTVEVDTTLSVEGMAADAKATGDAINEISTLVGDTSVVDQIKSATSSLVKTVNGDAPDENGNVSVQAGVTSVNGQTGDVTIEQYDILPIAKGGTNANEPVTARENLLMIVSDTEPITPVAGMIWFDIS